MKTFSELNKKWWWRLLKVAVISSAIGFILFVLSGAYFTFYRAPLLIVFIMMFIAFISSIIFIVWVFLGAQSIISYIIRGVFKCDSFMGMTAPNIFHRIDSRIQSLGKITKSLMLLTALSCPITANYIDDIFEFIELLPFHPIANGFIMVVFGSFMLVFLLSGLFILFFGLMYSFPKKLFIK